MEWPNGACPGKCPYATLKCKGEVDEPSALQGTGRAGGLSRSTFLKVDSRSGHEHIHWEIQTYRSLTW